MTIDDGAVEKASLRKRILLGTKLVVTIALYAFLIWKSDLGKLWETFRNLNLLLIPAIFILMLVSLSLSAYKWKVLLHIHNIHYGLWILHRYYFIGKSLSNILPTNIGGDAYRIYKTMNNSRSKSGAFVAVFSERITGILALMALGYIGSIATYYRYGDALSQSVMIGGSAGLVILVVVPYLLRRFKTLTWILTKKSCPKAIRHLADYGDDYGKNKNKSLWVIMISFIFHLHSLGLYWVLLYTVGATCDLSQLVFILAITTLIGLLPITINGIGSVDASFIYLIGQYGVGYEAALSAMLLVRGLTMLMSLVGVYFFLTREPARHLAQAQ